MGTRILGQIDELNRLVRVWVRDVGRDENTVADLVDGDLGHAPVFLARDLHLLAHAGASLQKAKPVVRHP
ncbi:MAG: hypothetical protein CL569_08515 [Alphaproteobacteria bacterium]|nr:hypothetical protein [Alphaproteobacteria bacterium]